jgi:hypothetical protein
VRSDGTRGGPARPGPCQGHTATPKREQGGAGEEAHREVGCGGGVALPRRCSSEEGVNPMGSGVAPANGGAPCPAHGGGEVAWQ